jgi:hypothetical protein
MQRLRLKADGRIVELRDGEEFPLAPAIAPAAVPQDVTPPAGVRDLRRRANLTQIEFAARLGVPVETIRNRASACHADLRERCLPSSRTRLIPFLPPWPWSHRRPELAVRSHPAHNAPQPFEIR